MVIKMEFTYKAYRDLLVLLKEEGYVDCNYHNYAKAVKSVILRHDIDMSIEKSMKTAQIDAEMSE